MLQVEKFVFNPFFENTYFVFNVESKESAVIDPGCYDEEERRMIDNFVKNNKLQLKYLINTHCHIDHIFGNAYIKERYNPLFLAPELDLFLLDLMVEQAKLYGTTFTPSPKPDTYISENIEITLGLSTGKFIFTPGHSPGGFCLYFDEEKICFTGDVLFKNNIGRTDLWKGDYNTLINSIKKKLFILPDDVKIFPGHDSESTIAYEKQTNPFVSDI